MTTHAPHSLPSFAQAFSDAPLGSISSGNNALPPIQTLSPPPVSRRAKSPRQSQSRHTSEEDRVAGRKRPRTELTTTTRDDEGSDSERDSPRLTRVKEEQEQDMLTDSPPLQASAPPPSSTRPSTTKKRRVTLSGSSAPPLNLNTDVRPPVDPSSTTPISPVVMGFTIMRDNPGAIEQVRSMISVKQKQKALIEQRRGSLAGSPNLGAGPPPASLTEEKPATGTRQRRSPNTSTTDSRRIANGAQGRPPSPGPAPVAQTPAATNQHSLPPPPISFARRRAEQLGGKRKPADIIISPREAHTQEQFQPAIQSAPPIPQGGGQAAYYSGRFSMALPRLPPVMGAAEPARKVAGHVPPTPTRFSMQRATTATTIPSISHPTGSTTRSPPAASVPISSTLVPPTPTSLQHPGYSGDKSAFLAPFEVFYDALNDSKQLKTWLGEQLQKSNALIQNLTQQQEKLNETVEVMVERRMASMRSEMAGLYRRVDELEDALRVATGRRQSVDAGSVVPKGKKPLRNGNLGAPEGYTFPPRPQPDRSRVEPPRRHPSPGWPQERDMVDSENGSPAPFDARRHSVSATRLDPPAPGPGSRTQGFETSSQRNTLNTPPQAFREHSSPSLSHGKVGAGAGPGSHASERPPLHPRTSHPTSAERSHSPQPTSRRTSVSPGPDGS